MNYLTIFEIQIFENHWYYVKYLAEHDFEKIEKIVDIRFSNIEILNSGFGAKIDCYFHV